MVDCTLENLDDGSATGLVFDDLSPAGLLSSVRRAFVLFRQPDQWAAVQRRAMGLPFDWTATAQLYLAIYHSLKPATTPDTRSPWGKE